MLTPDRNLIVSLAYLLFTHDRQRCSGGGHYDDSSSHPCAGRSAWPLGRIAAGSRFCGGLRALRLIGTVAAGPRLVASGGRRRADRGRLSRARPSLFAAVAADRPSVKAAVGSDGRLRAHPRRPRPALLLQQRSVSVDRRGAALGIPGSGAADRMALGAQPAPS